MKIAIIAMLALGFFRPLLLVIWRPFVSFNSRWDLTTCLLVMGKDDMSKTGKRLPYIVGWGIVLAALCGVLVWKVAA
jgi:hypothetical protein